MRQFFSLVIFVVCPAVIFLSACEQQNSAPLPEKKVAAAILESPPPSIAGVSHPILFVTQVPIQQDMNGRLSAFANHLTSPDKVPRGGDLMLRYPDGSLRNLTHEAKFGMQGLQGAQAIAVREPSVHSSGEKALFSMLIGSPNRAQNQMSGRWQIYQVSGFARGAKLKISKLKNQDARYNNVSPIYASDDSIIFTSDRPRTGEAHLYPQLDEYEATPAISGVWKMQPENGKLSLLTHTPSGAFNPLIDSFGRVLFTRWDHLQQDQLADRDRDAAHNKVALPFKSFNYLSEKSDAKMLDDRTEIFPESRVGSKSAYGVVNAFRNNFFTIWQINQDGTSEETLNHIGQHELAVGYLTPSFAEDRNLSNRTLDKIHANRFAIRREGGLFHLREDPLESGSFFAVNARESGSFTTDTLVKIKGGATLNPEQMTVTAVTLPNKSDNLSDGRYRNPLPLSDGRFIASHTSNHLPPEAEQSLNDLRLKFLRRDSTTGFYTAGEPLTKGIQKTLSWWDGKKIQTYHGNLWELEAVEVRTSISAKQGAAVLEAPERAIFMEEKIDEAALRAWLTKRNLALIITRDQTSRDRADLQQPFNLQVAGGVKTLSKFMPGGKLYAISHFQILQAEQLRAYPDRPGRRNLARPINNFDENNLTKLADAGVESAVLIAKDGSTAAFVPAGRALTWQTTDEKGNPVVRERNWLTFQAGEIRTCASCHGVNSLNQAGAPSPVNKALALRELLNRWKKFEK